MKRTRAQRTKAPEPQQDPAVADADAGNNPKLQRRAAKQPRQPKGAAKKPAAATRGAPEAAAANAAAHVVASPGPETAPTVPDVCGGAGEAGARAVDDWDLDAGLGGGSAWWWTWGGVDEDKLLGWFPFVEEDFRCRAGDADVAFDDDIWRIHQIHEIPNYASK